MANVHLLTSRHEGRALFWAALLLNFLFLAVIVPPSEATATDDILPDIPPSYQMVAENDLFQLYMDSSTLAFKLLDKRSNYLWHSGIDELLEDDRLNRSWQAFAQSGL